MENWLSELEVVSWSSRNSLILMLNKNLIRLTRYRNSRVSLTEMTTMSTHLTSRQLQGTVHHPRISEVAAVYRIRAPDSSPKLLVERCLKAILHLLLWLVRSSQASVGRRGTEEWPRNSLIAFKLILGSVDSLRILITDVKLCISTLLSKNSIESKRGYVKVRRDCGFSLEIGCCHITWLCWLFSKANFIILTFWLFSWLFYWFLFSIFAA